MNTVGKILVVLNLVFALAAGAFMVLDFATRTNAHRKAEDWERNATVANTNSVTHRQTTKLLADENKKLRKDLDQFILNSKSDLSVAEGTIKDLKGIVKKAQDEATEQGVLAKKAAAEAGRLKEEVKLQGGIIDKRQEQIASLLKDADLARIRMTQAEEQARSALDRMQTLVRKLQELETVIAKYQAGPAADKVASVRDPNYHNPPQGYVKGIIRKVDTRDRGLVEISIGSDVGVKEDHTLEIYRLKPQPEYLGRLRIVESFPHYAVGRLVRVGTSQLPQIQERDEVASSIK